MPDKKRYRVVGKDYVKFGDVKVKRGDLIPVNIKVDKSLVKAGWVEKV